MVKAGGEITPPTTAFRWFRAAKWAFSAEDNRFSDRCYSDGLTAHRSCHSRRSAVAAEAGTLTGVPDPTRLAAREAREKRNPSVGRTDGGCTTSYAEAVAVSVDQPAERSASQQGPS